MSGTSGTSGTGQASGMDGMGSIGQTSGMPLEGALRNLLGEPSVDLKRRVALALAKMGDENAAGLPLPSPGSNDAQAPPQRLRPRLSRVALVAVLVAALALFSGIVAFALNAARIIEVLERVGFRQVQPGASALVESTLADGQTLHFSVCDITLTEMLNDGVYLYFACELRPTDEATLLLPAYFAGPAQFAGSPGGSPMSLLGPRFSLINQSASEYIATNKLNPYLITVSRAAVEIPEKSPEQALSDDNGDESGTLFDEVFLGMDDYNLSYESDGSILMVGSFSLPVSGEGRGNGGNGELELLVSVEPAYLGSYNGALLPEGTKSLRERQGFAVPVLASPDVLVMVNAEPTPISRGMSITDVRVVNTPIGTYVYLIDSITNQEAYGAALAEYLETLAAEGPQRGIFELGLPIVVEITLDDEVALPILGYGTGADGKGERVFAQFILPAQADVPSSITLVLASDLPPPPSRFESGSIATIATLGPLETVRIDLVPEDADR
jgi:hypothetical protein